MLLFISMFIIMFIFYAITAMVLESAHNHEARRKTHMHVWNNKW